MSRLFRGPWIRGQTPHAAEPIQYPHERSTLSQPVFSSLPESAPASSLGCPCTQRVPTSHPYAQRPEQQTLHPSTSSRQCHVHRLRLPSSSTQVPDVRLGVPADIGLPPPLPHAQHIGNTSAATTAKKPTQLGQRTKHACQKHAHHTTTFRFYFEIVCSARAISDCVRRAISKALHAMLACDHKPAAPQPKQAVRSNVHTTPSRSKNHTKNETPSQLSIPGSSTFAW